MAFVKKTWKDRIAEFPTRRRLTKEDNTSELVTVAREEGTLSQEGDAFSAENMNDLENRIDAEFTEVNGKLQSGCFIKNASDYTKPIKVNTDFIAPYDCYVVVSIGRTKDDYYIIYIDDVNISGVCFNYSNNWIAVPFSIYLKKGQKFRIEGTNAQTIHDHCVIKL